MTLGVFFCSSRERSEQSLVRWATPQLHDIDALSKMVDPALNGMYPAKSLSRFADIIALCVQVPSFFETDVQLCVVATDPSPWYSSRNYKRRRKKA
jgi:hypothetical protein